MAFFETKNQYHRYNFYEIKKTLANGEDVRTVVPRNPAEVNLIANMLGGSSAGGSSAGGVPIHVDNNPELKGLYIGLVASNGFTKFSLDLCKFAEALETYGSLNNYTLDDSVLSLTTQLTTTLIAGAFMNGICIIIKNDSIGVELYGGDSANAATEDQTFSVWIKYNELNSIDGDLTFRKLFNAIGRVDVNLVKDNGTRFLGMPYYFYQPYLGANPYNMIKLNERPIEYMWFE